MKDNTGYLTDEIQILYGKSMSETLNDLEEAVLEGKIRKVLLNSVAYWLK